MEDSWQRIYKSSLKFLVPLEVQQSYITIVREAIDLVGGSHGSIFLFQEGELKRIYTTYHQLKSIKPRKSGITYEVFRNRVPNLRHRESLINANKKFSKLPIQSDITVPLIYGHITLGVLSILSRKGVKFEENDLDTLTLFAPLATLAIRKSQLLEDAERAIVSRNLFMALAEHEIKTPLALISLNIEMLKNKKSVQELPEYKYVERLDKATQRLIRLVNELLQTDNIDTEDLEYNFQKVNIIKLVSSMSRDLSNVNKTHRFIFKNPTKKEEIEVSCDTNKIRQVMTNLVNNAVKFSPKKSTITIKLSKNKFGVTISIADQGIGIAKKDLNKIFNKYYQAKGNGDENGDPKGMGIGLYLVREIVNKHNGSITVKSTVGKGTTVKVMLPYNLD